MTNKQESIVPIFRAERKPFDENDISTEFIFEGSYWDNSLNNCHLIKSYSEKQERYINVEIKPETLQMSLDNGTTWATMVEVREALEFKMRHDKEGKLAIYCNDNQWHCYKCNGVVYVGCLNCDRCGQKLLWIDNENKGEG